MRRRTVVLAVAAALILAAAVGGGLVVAHRGQSGRAALDAVLPQLESFVERTRGLRFVTPPKVELVGDRRFDELYNGGGAPASPEQRADDQAYAGLLRALGLADSSVDVGAATANNAQDVVGFYDSQTKVLYARGTRPNAYVKDVLVHELTHALDDQHFGIDHDVANDDASSAYDALIEGSAMVVENRWYDSRPRAEQDAIDKADSAGAPAEGPSSQARNAPADFFGELFDFPYDSGPDFVQALLDAGGQARLDRAFADPPATTEQVMHHDRYLAGEGAGSVATPPADGPVVDDGTMGELGLLLVLERAVDHDTAVNAAAGWGGDHYVEWKAGDGYCVRWSMLMDTPRDITELAAAVRSWTAAHPAARVSGTDPLVITACT